MFDKYWIKKVNQSFVIVEDYDVYLLENYNNYVNAKLEYVTMNDFEDLKVLRFSDIISDFCKNCSYIIVSVIEKKNDIVNRYTCWNGKYYKDEIYNFNIIENFKNGEFIISLFFDIESIEFLGNSVYKEALVFSGILIEKINNSINKINEDINFIKLNSNYITKKMGYNVNELLLMSSIRVEL